MTLYIRIGPLMSLKHPTSSNSLEVTSYYMDPSILKTVDDYTPLSPVRLFMVPGQVGQLIFHVRYGKEPREVSTVGALLSDYRYFRIFAWADHIDFNLDCVVEESSSFSFGDMDVAPPQLTKTFWVLKIRDETWDVHTF